MCLHIGIECLYVMLFVHQDTSTLSPVATCCMIGVDYTLCNHTEESSSLPDHLQISIYR